MLPTTGNMRFTSRLGWQKDPLTRQMAALATLGFKIVVEQAWDDLTGTGRTVFLHSAKTTLPQRSALPGAKQLMRLFRSGDLESTDPEHPLLDALGTIASFEALEAWRLEGKTCCLAADAMPKGQGTLAARRGRLVAGIPPQSSKGGHVDIANAANAAALTRLGVPVLALHQQDSRTVYRMAALGVPLALQPAVKTADLMQMAGEGKLPWDHPFLTARQGVLDFVKLMTTCQEATNHTVITWRNTQDRRQASLLSSASSRARDIAHRHMK